MHTVGKFIDILCNPRPSSSNTPTNRRRNVKNLLTQSIAEKRRFIQSFDDILADCDGTIWGFEGPLPGVRQAIARLEKFGKRFIYVTNNSTRTDEEFLAKFKSSGIVVNIKDVIHPAIATVEYLRERNFDGLLYTIGSDVCCRILQDAGFKTIDGPHDICDRKPSMMKSVRDGQQVDAVVLDADMNLSLSKLIRAHLYLHNPECVLIVGATDMVFALDGECSVIGPGPFYKALEAAIGREAVLLGKPGKDLADIIVRKYNLRDRRRVLVIGDMLEQDIGFANAAGFQSLAVLTGGAKLESFESHPRLDELPDYYLNSFADFSTILDELVAADIHH